MIIQKLVFYFFALLAIASSCMVILSKQPVRAVLNLVFCFFCTAGLWMLLESELLAIVLVLVYVGAVMVLFLFVVMMIDMEVPRGAFVKFWPIGLIIAGLTLTLLVLTVGKQHFGIEFISMPTPHSADYSQVKELGALLYSDYLLPFEIAGIILLVAMIAAIGLTFRGARNVKTPQVAKQIQVTKAQRLKIIRMPTEKGEAP